MVKNFVLIFWAITFIAAWFLLADNMIAAYIIGTRFPNEVNALWRACNGNVNCGIVGVFMNIAAIAAFITWLCSK